MKLWLLRPCMDRPEWDPWYDKAFGFVVRAANEQTARQLAASDAGDEGKDAWLSPQSSTCEILTRHDSLEPEIVISDFYSA